MRIWDRAWAIVSRTSGRFGVLVFAGPFLLRYVAWGNAVMGQLSDLIPFGLDATVVLSALGILLILWAIVKGPPRPRIEFYDSRSQLNKFRGGIQGEIDGASELWVAWATARIAAVEGILNSRKLTRILLLDPDHPHLAEYAEMVGFGVGQHKTDIATATQIILRRRDEQNHTVEIKWVSGPMIFVTIGNPRRWNGWARVDDYFSGQARPSYVVYKLWRRRLFNQIVAYYDSIAERAHPPR